MKKLFIIDLMPFLYRGHFVFLKSPRMTSTGINTSALLGFANGVTSILKDFSPTHAVLAMDPGGPTFRHEAYPPYKAQREKMPEDLAASIPYAFELAEALRIPVLRKEGFEADDVMGTLAVRAAAEGFDVYLATPDKDAAQLVAPHIRLFRPGRRRTRTPRSSWRRISACSVPAAAAATRKSTMRRRCANIGSSPLHAR